jgi:hypothetical protein
VTGGWRKLNNEEFHNKVKEDEVGRNIARMGRRRKHIGCWRESHNEKVHCEDQDVGGWTILKWILERLYGMIWIGLMLLRIGISRGLL